MEAESKLPVKVLGTYVSDMLTPSLVQPPTRSGAAFHIVANWEIPFA